MILNWTFFKQCVSITQGTAPPHGIEP